MVDDPVIDFFNRGRSTDIVTFSEPGFNSYWSGNTTDICPVGALTTADFRFRARPWELRAAASLCNQCPVGCNITLNVRREAVSGGKWVVKRVMPRQNEEVNEIWICDKGRFGYHFADQSEEPPSGAAGAPRWRTAPGFLGRCAGAGRRTLHAGRIQPVHPGGWTAWLMKTCSICASLPSAVGGETALYSHMAGGELTTQVGLAPGSNFADMGAGALSWWLPATWKKKRRSGGCASSRRLSVGAKVIVLNPRRTKLDRAAAWALRYPFGSAAAAVMAMLNAISPKRPELPEAVQELARSAELRQAATAFKDAQDAVVLYGSEGMGLAESAALAQACANLLLVTGHVGRANNGLLGVWPRANDQGAWEMGLRPRPDLLAALQAANALYIAAADPVGDDPAFQSAFGEDKFVVVQELFLTRYGPPGGCGAAGAGLDRARRQLYLWRAARAALLSGDAALHGGVPRRRQPWRRRSPLLKSPRPELQGPQVDFAIPAFIAHAWVWAETVVHWNTAAVVFCAWRRKFRTLPV